MVRWDGAMWASPPTESYHGVRRGGALPRPRATARVAPTEALQEVQWAGDRKGRPYGDYLKFLDGRCGCCDFL